MRYRCFFLACLALMLWIPGALMAGDYRYISPEEVHERILNKEPMHIFDIQVKEEYARHHLPGAIQSCAYPVKTDEDRARVDPFVEELAKGNDPVVIVCPRGEGGARRTYDYLKDKGIAEDRLLILEKGQQGWTYEDMTEAE